MSALTNRIGFAVASGLLLAALALPAAAQDAPGGSRWLAFVGCWEPLGADGETGLLCFRPTGGGVEMSNVYQGEVTATEVLLADGIGREVTAEGCTGTESLQFSEDGRRIFTTSEFVCGGGEERSGTGVMSFIAPSQWIDVRSLTVEGEPVAWVQRYSAATSESLRDHGADDPMTTDRAAIRSRRLAAAREIDLGDVEEALARVDPQAVKIWVATQEPVLDIDGAALVRLADAGVPDDVIDVLVAVSFPDRFVVTPEGVSDGVVERVAQNAYVSGTRFGFRSFLYDPFYFDPFYAPFGYRYGYSPYGFSRFGSFGFGFGGYYGYVPTAVVVVDRNTRAAGGRMVNGRGYRGPRSGGSVSGGGYSGGGGGVARSSGSGGRSSSGSSGSSRSSGGGRSAVRR